MSRNIPRDQRAVTRANGYAAMDDTVSTTATLPTVTRALLTSAPPRPPSTQALAKLSRVGVVVSEIGDDLSETGRSARLISTYTGNPITSATAIMTISRANVRRL